MIWLIKHLGYNAAPQILYAADHVNAHIRPQEPYKDVEYLKVVYPPHF